MKCISFVAVFVGVCASVGFGCDWSMNPGDGSVDKPYQISEPNQLIAIGANEDLLDKHFILINDLVFDPNNNPEHIFSSAVIAPDIDEMRILSESWLRP